MPNERVTTPSGGAMIRVISLGAGVQSSTLYLMAVHGEFGGERPSVAIFADTQWEPKAVIEWLAKLRQIGGHVIPIRDATAGSLREMALQRVDPVNGKPYRRVTLPLFVAIPKGDARQITLWDLDPSFRPGMLKRQCTDDFKISVIRRAVRQELGVGPRDPVEPGAVEQWIGISTDEADRMTDSGVAFVRNRYPLIERDMSRDACAEWLVANGYPIPPKSACVGCPFTSDARWAEMKRNRPDEFADACAFDEAVRTGLVGVEHSVYLHRSLVPLRDVEFDEDDVFGGFSNECKGMCGV